MKKILLTMVTGLLLGFQLNAQTVALPKGKVGYINTETILAAIPEYKLSQEKLEALGKQYKDKVEGEVKKIEMLYANYQSAKGSLNEYQREQRENEIISLERNVKEQQKVYFGQDGVMQKKSEELLNPIKTKVQQAIDKIAKEGNFMLIFDLAAMQGVAYASESDNLSGMVIKVLGY